MQFGKIRKNLELPLNPVAFARFFLKGALLRWLCLLCAALSLPVQAAHPGGLQQARDHIVARAYWVDQSGQASLAQAQGQTYVPSRACSTRATPTPRTGCG